jgi:hypothetical protein
MVMQPIKLFQRKNTEQDIEDELLHHVGLLTQAYLDQGMSFEEARGAALKRFGNMNEIKNECVKISSNNPFLLLVKTGLLMLFLFGVLMRIFIPVENFRHLADILMWLAVLGRLFMYVRSLKPSLFVPKNDNASPLSLINKSNPAIPTYDQRALTPLERVISDK